MWRRETGSGNAPGVCPYLKLALRRILFIGGYVVPKKANNKLPPFVALTWAMLNSKAYKDLQSTAGKMLPYFIGKVRFGPSDPQKHTTTFTFTFKEAKALGCAKKTFYRVIQALMESGFIDPVKKGGLRGFNQSSSVFKLSRRWEKYGEAGFEKVQWECF